MTKSFSTCYTEQNYGVNLLRHIHICHKLVILQEIIYVTVFWNSATYAVF